MSRDKILQVSWSISAALARGFSDSDRHFERREGPRDEVVSKQEENAWVLGYVAIMFAAIKCHSLSRLKACTLVSNCCPLANKIIHQGGEKE